MKWTTASRSIKDLIPFATNPRQMTKKQNADLRKSLERFDLVEIPAINLDGTILAGHQRLRIMAELGRGDEQIDVRIPDRQLTEEEAREYLVRSNKNTGEWDFDMLANSFDTPELIEWGFEPTELGILPGKIEEDSIPDAPTDPVTKLGDLYQLGVHRLLCGDSTKLEDMETLMNGELADMVLTDPPYNTGMTEAGQGETTPWRGKGKKDASTRLKHMFNDKYTPQEWDLFLQQTLSNLYKYTKEDSAFYIFIDWRRLGDVKEKVEALMHVSNVIVWDKMVHGLGSDYKYTYELIIVGKKGKPIIANRIGEDYRDIWHLQRKIGKNEDHATAKLVELCVKPILHASKEGGLVLDLFGGSGTTLIAAEQTKRRSNLVEINPSYCDVIVKRWEQLTGEKAKKL